MNYFKKEPNPTQDLLVGLAIAAVTYGIIWLLLFLNIQLTVKALLSAVVFVVYGIAVVKFFRARRTNAAILMLVLITPAAFLLMLLGSCSLMMI